ncbi:hypothetical protein [Longimicrobium sp.]|uniref:hypothetical protein n=1 Tax=Longimicrobium sp. TaxID=2029185 RepID=UPI002C0E47A6|nr:hypothetical protein [Longimicrobium sp.]HSU15714.1 hypothetical protein [Longimicrobium sp.]
MADDPRREDELSVEELDSVAGGVIGDNTNCSQGCTSNSNCGGTKEPTTGPVWV